MSDIPFNIPFATGAEFDYIRDAIARRHVSGDGVYTRKCHEFLQESLGVKKAFLTTSCTDALEMTAILLDLRPGDEVILPSFTFVSTANAFALHGARPVFVDIREDTLNMDERLVGGKITERTKAIVPVHYAGVGCEMDAILETAAARGVAVVEDNAHGLFGTYREKNLGTFGCMATQSFHETKNFICGEGGALLINDERYIGRAEIIREKGTNRSRFFRGQVDKYTWVDVGSSFLPSDILAAFLWAQFEARRNIQGIRERIWNRYQEGLAGWAKENSVRLPVIPAHCGQPFHMFYLIMDSLDRRQRFIAFLKERGMGAVFHYLPLHLSDMGVRFGGKAGDCPVTERVSDRLVRLPFYNGLSPEDQDRVIEAILSFKD